MFATNYVPSGMEQPSLQSNSHYYDHVAFRQQLPQHSAPQYGPSTMDMGYVHAPTRTASPLPLLQNPGNDYTTNHSYSLPAAHSNLNRTMPSPQPQAYQDHHAASYPAPYDRSPNMYAGNMYGSPAPMTRDQNAPMPSTFSYPQPLVSSTTPPNQPFSRPMSALGRTPSVRVLDQKPKPQCWDHGCNGREFSTFSNLLRHQREKSGTASKSYCPKCGAEFTRTTARNGHLAHEKCSRQRRSSGSAGSQ